MKYVLDSAVFALMVSIGMSLRPSQLLAHWRSFTWLAWLRLILATFIVPPAVVLLLHRLLPLKPAEAVGLFMVAAVPGAPLMTRNIARRGFDMQLAASYQVWGAVLTPLMIPLVVFVSGQLYDRDIWIPPVVLVVHILEKQFVPLLVGLAMAHYVSALSRKLQPVLNVVGNVVLTVLIVALLVKMRAEVGRITPWLLLGAFLLAASAIAVVWVLLPGDRVSARTLAICNANRHVGLALLLSGQYLHRTDALPAIACYALVIFALMLLYPKLLGRRRPAIHMAA